MRCAKCGHSWHQPGPEPEISADQPQAQIAPQAPNLDETVVAPAPLSGTRAFAPVAQIPERSHSTGLQTFGLVAGWVGLIAVVLLIGYSAVVYRQDIATIWPQSAGVYSGLGLKVNANGIDFKDVTYKRGSEDGQTVLTVSGAIVNTAGGALSVPQTVRVTLSDADNRELYHQDFKPDAVTFGSRRAIGFPHKDIQSACGGAGGNREFCEGRPLNLPPVLFSADDIALRLRALCKTLAMLPERAEVAAPVLVGAFVFAADLMRGMAQEGVQLETEMIWLRSYGQARTGGSLSVCPPSAIS